MKKYFNIRALMVLVMSFYFVFFLVACGDSSNENNVEVSFPEGSVELIVPFDAGGGTDAVARALADNAEEYLDESIAVLNVSGGGGAVGMEKVAHSDPDGYELALATVELTTLPPLDLADFTHEDFDPIAQINLDPAAITVSADSEWDTVEEFIEYAKENPGEVKIGNSGTGAIWHLAAVLIEQETGVEFNHIPYEGGAPAVTALLSGEVDAVTVSPAEVLTQVEAGDLETLAVAADERADIMPDVPTMEEAGIGDITAGKWRGIVARKDTDHQVVEIL